MFNHILILDDSQDILNILQEVLTDEGYRVTALNHCENILQTIHEHQPHLVVLDFLLHGINGGELCHQIKTNPLTSHIPVIILSGYPRVLESLGTYGSDSFIAKPFSLDELFGTVSNFLPAPAAMAAFQ